MGVLPQAQEIMFEGQRKMSNEKIARTKKKKKKKLCNSQNMIFFLFSSSL
jgi:hypothetical protein